MKKRYKEVLIDKEHLIDITKNIVVNLVSGMLGFAIGWIFDGRVILSLIVFSVLAFFATVAWIVSTAYEKRVSILELLNEEIKKGHYQGAVKLGYSVSRALFLSGKNKERYLISEKVYQALNELDDSLIINDKKESVALVKAKLLIDECGWSLYLLNGFNNRYAAENRIKDGINQCLRISATSSEAEKTYPVVFKALRHLFGMCVNNFEELQKNTLANNNDLVEKYMYDIHKYGDLLGFLLSDRRMSNIDGYSDYYTVFCGITMNAKNSKEYFDSLIEWVKIKSLDKSFLLSTYNFRTKYFLSLIKSEKLKDNSTNIENYLSYAKELSIKMTLGYASNESELDWLVRSTISFANEVGKFKDDYSFISPDPDRFVKSYLLLGKVAMISNDLQSLEDARTAFNKAIVQSKAVNRTQTYLSAQRKLISVNERIFILKDNLGAFDSFDRQNELQTLLDKMESIQNECKQYLGRSDEKMKESCRERKRRYKKMMEN